jgi:two-component system, LytTR family, sensor kinase
MNNKTLRWFRFGMIPVLASILYASLVLLSPPDELVSYYSREWWTLPTEMFFVIVFATLYSESNIGLSNYLDTKITWQQKPVRRSTIQFFLSFCMGSLLGFLVVKFFEWIFPSDYPMPPVYQILISGFLIALPITLVYTILYLFGRWEKSILEAEALKRENIEARYEALKNQLDPHFLFNNLNTLTAIVEENPRKAVDFIQKLSHVYRYILQNRDKNEVTLKEEIQLAEAYIFLLKQRYEDHLDVRFDVSNAVLDATLPPMTLQLLLENVVKHNVIDHKHPLSIRLFFEEKTGQLVLENTLKLKTNTEISTKIGLQNINSRLLLMGQNGLTTQTTDTHFMVSLPLKTTTQ